MRTIIVVGSQITKNYQNGAGTNTLADFERGESVFGVTVNLLMCGGGAAPERIEHSSSLWVQRNISNHMVWRGARPHWRRYNVG